MQPIPDHHEVVDHPPPRGRFWNKFILAMQFLLLGTIMSILFTISYTYKELPSYNIVAVFSLIGLIPNFRFLISPLIQNHTSLTYGKRKTWMQISTICIAILTFVASFFTGDEQQIQIGFIFLFQKIFVGLNHTAIDALALKEYQQKSKMSFLQTTVYRAGGVFGGLGFLKLISPTFCLHFGRKTPFLTVKQYFMLISLICLAVAVISHFLYQQDEWTAEEIIMHKNYCQLVKQYKVFLDIDNAYCRLVIFFFLHHLGLASFISGFRYVIIQQYGYNREDFITITTVMIFAIMPFAYLFSRHIGQDTMSLKIQIVLIGRWIVDVIGFALKLNSTLSLSIFFFFSDGFRQFQGILIHTIMNDLSNVGLAGMFLSASSSLRKAVQNHSWSLKLIDVFGYELCCVVGFIQQLIILAYIPYLIKWVFEGQKPEEVKEVETEEQSQ